MAWGLLTPIDVETLRASLKRAIANAMARSADQRPFRVVEIGVCHGDTARAIRDVVVDYFAGLTRPIVHQPDEALLDAPAWQTLQYLGIDNGRDRPIDRPFDAAQLVIGDSAELFPAVVGDYGFDEIDWLLIDGCHCSNHVALDFLNYGALVAPGGEVCFHDISARAQGKLDYQGHGPRTSVSFGTAVREALAKVGLHPLVRDDWAFQGCGIDPNVDWGGVAAFRHVRPSMQYHAESGVL